jgi:branched-chain amino acid transport system substrate-binding protein
MSKWVAVVAVIMIVVSTQFVARSQVAPPYEINALLSLTGPAAFLGKETMQTLRVAEQVTNVHGGIRGRPVKFVVVDDESNPQTAVSLANQIIAKGASVFVGPVFASPCSPMLALVGKTGPVDFCLSPGIQPANGSYVFSAGVSPQDMAAVMVRYFRLKHWNRIALITSTDTSGQQLDRAFEYARQLPENRSLIFVAAEHFNVVDMSATAQLVRIKAAKPDVVIAWTTGTAFGTLLHGIRDAGLDVPIGGGNANMLYTQMAQYVDIAPKELYFDGFRALTPGTVGKGPIADAQAIYFNGFAKAGIRPDAAHAATWDGVMIVIDALRHLPPNASAEQVRSYIANLHSWAGINGIYDFRAGDQRGTTQAALVMDRWIPEKNEFQPVSKPAGYLK